MKKWVLGDIHGGLKALEQCLERANVNTEEDRIIILGDVCDGWPEVKECVDRILTFKNCEYILGNHDTWTLDWMKYGEAQPLWLSQGGEATRQSYQKNGIPDSHIRFFERAKIYLEENNDLFVHGGVWKGSRADQNQRNDMLWDRTLASYSKNCMKFKKSNIAKPYNRIFIGHTTTTFFGFDTPIIGGRVYNLDTGGGWEGRLSIMEISTEEWWQSDIVAELYPECKGRR